VKKLPGLLTVLLIITYFEATAQTILQETIEYDFSTNQFTVRPSWTKEGSSVLLRYKNINKYALKSSATITSGNRSYDDGLSQLQAGLQQVAGEKEKVKEEGKKNDAKMALITVKNSAKDKPLLTEMERYLNVKAGKLENIEGEFKTIYQGVLKVNSIMSMDKDITAAVDDPTLNTHPPLKAAVFIQSGTTDISTPAEFTSKLNSTVLTINNSLGTIRTLINQLKDNFTDATLPAERQKEEGPKLDKLITELEKRVSTIEAAYSGQNLKTLQDNSSDMGRRSLKLLNQDFIIAPVVVGNADGDYIEISDKLIDNAGKQILEIKPFKINTYGGSRIDFSIGLSVNIGGHGEYKYDLRKNPSNATSGTSVDSVILLSDDEDRLFKFSPTIFVHWYKNTKCKVQWMLTTGLTPDFTDVSDSRLSIGTSFGFPSSNNLTRRLILGAGISFGYADVLKTKYKGLVDYRTFGELEATELTDKALKLGAFFSISYNLGGTGHD